MKCSQQQIMIHSTWAKNTKNITITHDLGASLIISSLLLEKYQLLIKDEATGGLPCAPSFCKLFIVNKYPNHLVWWRNVRVLTVSQTSPVGLASLQTWRVGSRQLRELLMTKLYGQPCRGGSVFSVLQDCMVRSASMKIDRLCRPPLTNVEPHKSGNFMIFAKKTGLELLRKIIMTFLVEFCWDFLCC